jgi:hypothetical protein
MKRLNKFNVIAALSIVVIIAMFCSTLFSGMADAQLFPMPVPFGYDGFGVPGYDGFGVPVYGGYGLPAYGGYGMPAAYGMPAYYSQQMPYGQPIPYGQQMPVSQQTPYTGGNVAPAAGGAGFLSISGLEGLQGFMAGTNRMSLAVMPVSQQGNQLGFQVIGFAISSPDTGTATVYALKTPLAGVIDPSQNTLQVDLTNLDSAIQQAGYINSNQVYDTIRTDPKVVVIDIDMAYQGIQGSQTIFNVNAVSIIPPDGKMQAFSMQQPTQLIIDTQTMRLYMVAFPQMVSTLSSYYGASFTQVLPIVYAQPIPILAPVFVPFLTPFPIFFSSFIGFNPFFFGSGFVSFFNFDRFHGRFPIHDREFGRSEFNEFRRGVAGVGAGGKIGAPNVPSLQKPGNIGAGIGAGGKIGVPSMPSLQKPGNIGAGIGAGNRIGTPNMASFQKPAIGNIGTGMGNAGFRPASIGTGIGTGMGSAMNIKPVGALGAGIGGGMRMGGGRR